MEKSCLCCKKKFKPHYAVSHQRYCSDPECLNWSGRSINEMEEALVLQSLHREDGLTQIEIATLLGRDKSWVSRRISLIERISEEVQEDIRLGLISVITGRELAKLPRGNQKEAAEAILKRHYTTREAAKLIGYAGHRESVAIGNTDRKTRCSSFLGDGDDPVWISAIFLAFKPKNLRFEDQIETFPYPFQKVTFGKICSASGFRYRHNLGPWTVIRKIRI